MNPPIEFNENTKQYNTEIVTPDQPSDPDAQPALESIGAGPHNARLTDSCRTAAPAAAT
jgi:hypothetical protein